VIGQARPPPAPQIIEPTIFSSWSRPALIPPLPGGRAPLWLVALAFALPALLPLIWRLATGYWWWRDFDAVLCGGMQAARGLPLYAPHPACPGLQAADFVYPPQIAWLAAWAERHASLGALRTGFGLVHAGACLWLGWLMLLRPMAHASTRERLPGLGLVIGVAIACGNVAIGCHALAAASLLAFPRTRAPFIAAVALLAVIKPTYAIYLVVLLLDKAPWRERLIRAALGGLAVGAAWAAILWTGGGEVGHWVEALTRVLIPVNMGGGLLRLMANLGLPSQGPAALAAFALYAPLMTIAGIAIAEAREPAFTAEERWLFGLGLVQLINPRPMSYDMVALAPTVALIGVAAGGVSPGFGRLIRRWILALCLIATALGAVFLGGHALVWTPILLAFTLMSVGLALAWRRLRPPAPAAAALEPAL
jgi:hypothetical protein